MFLLLLISTKSFEGCEWSFPLLIGRQIFHICTKPFENLQTASSAFKGVFSPDWI
jgi:hypothetical protein